MRLATISLNGKPQFGAVTPEGFINLSERFKGRCPDIRSLLSQGLLAEATAIMANAKPDIALEALVFLPVIPNRDSKIFALGWSYLDHQLETGKEAPKFPSVFFKFPQAFVGHQQPLIKPNVSDTFDFEGEIALVIGKGGRNIPAANGRDHIGGYTIVMDGSIREWQKHSIPAGKNFEASSAMGPWMVTADEVPDPGKLFLNTRLNGISMQSSAFSLMAWDLGYLVHYLSTICTLEPGDVIATGTPAGVGHKRTPPLFMKAGDMLEIDVQGIGILRNTIANQ